jgi:hypothetical protein
LLLVASFVVFFSVVSDMDVASDTLDGLMIMIEDRSALCARVKSQSGRQITGVHLACIRCEPHDTTLPVLRESSTL